MPRTTAIQEVNRKLDYIIDTLDDVFLSSQEATEINEAKIMIKNGEHKKLPTLDDIRAKRKKKSNVTN